MAEATTTEASAAAAATESRPAIYLPSYKLGDEGKPNHFTASTSRENAAIEAKALAAGDAAFIKRSDLKWTYAVVTELVTPAPGAEAEGGKPPATILRFEVDKDKNRKSFPEAQWGKYIRVIKVDEAELAKMKEEEAAAKAKEEEETEAPTATPTEATTAVESATEAPTAASTSVEPATEAPTAAAETTATTAAASSAASVGGESAKSGKSNKSNKSSKSKGGKSAGGSSWFSNLGLFSATSKKSDEGGTEVSAAVPEAPEEEEETEAPPTAAPTEATTAVTSVEPATEASTSVGPATDAPTAAETTAEATTASLLGASGSIEYPIEAHTAPPMTEDPAALALAATSFPKPAESESVDSPVPETTAPTAAPEAAPEVVAPIKAAPEPVAPVVAEPNDTKENSDPVVASKPDKVASSKPVASEKPPVISKGSGSGSVDSKEKQSSISNLRNPLNLKSTLSLKKKNSLVNKLFNKSKKEPKEEKKTVTMAQSAAPPANPATSSAEAKRPPGMGKKEWFDPEASEVDYDKNPTDLFQALEARQFPYAEEMFKQVNKQFTKECKTWVVARGQKKKDSQLRFRALPLHAALVFGAPDDMVLKILNAYPKATRGRDVKGRLPVHLAMEHNASEKVLTEILEAFPKGFFAKDKKDMTSLDYVNGNMERAYMKRYVPLLTAAKVEDEKAKWENEKQAALAQQRIDLKNDPAYMADVVERVTDEIETTYATKMEMLEGNYQKEIQLLKKKHDSETQALLEGFEVKLNFERKLNKLKGKA